MLGQVRATLLTFSTSCNILLGQNKTHTARILFSQGDTTPHPPSCSVDSSHTARITPHKYMAYLPHPKSLISLYISSTNHPNHGYQPSNNSNITPNSILATPRRWKYAHCTRKRLLGPPRSQHKNAILYARYAAVKHLPKDVKSAQTVCGKTPMLMVLLLKMPVS